MTVKESAGSELVWKSLDENGKPWFEGKFNLLGFDPIESTDDTTAQFIKKLLKACVQNSPEFLAKWKKLRVETKMNFPRDWGLGSSSTTIHMAAQWADANPFMVFFRFQDGSGYDIACAGAEGPVEYQLIDDSIKFTEIELTLPFKDNLYFIYSGQKQSSADAVKMYKKAKVDKKAISEKLTGITDAIFEAKKLSDFEKLIDQHEDIVADALNLKKVKDEKFSDYWGSIKSLGAWGGDFILATSEKGKADVQKYFADKGCDVCHSYDDLIL